MIIKNIGSKLSEWSSEISDFIRQFDRNPLFYGGLFLLGVAIFYIVYDALNKN